MEEFKVTARRSEFKGHPTIVLATDNDRFPFQFGLTKARRIVSCIEAIKAFVAEEEAKVVNKVAVK